VGSPARTHYRYQRIYASSLAVRGDDMTLVLRSERFGKAFSAGLNSFIQEARLLARFNHPNLLQSCASG
jgi:hypothetical protein